MHTNEGPMYTVLFLLVISYTEMKYMRRKAGYIWTDYKTNTQIHGIKNNTDFGQITGIQGKLDTTCK